MAGEDTTREDERISRRSALSLAAGWAAFVGSTAAMGAGIVRFLFPNVTFEPPQQFKVGFPTAFGVGGSESFKSEFGVWICRNEEQIYALIAVCTHLGCTPNWLAGEAKFKCPCHGSGFIKTGVNIEGPAPRPLERYKIMLAEDGQLLIDKNTKYQQEKGQWELDGAYLPYTA